MHYADERVGLAQEVEPVGLVTGEVASLIPGSASLCVEASPNVTSNPECSRRAGCRLARLTRLLPVDLLTGQQELW